VKILDILLLNALDRDKTHRRALGRFGDGLGVVVVIFVTFDKGLHILWRNKLDIMAQRREFSGPMVRAATRFHRHYTGFEAGKIAATHLMGRRTAAKLRKQASGFGWLDPAHSLPVDEALARVLHPPKTQHVREQSSLHPYRELIAQWYSEGINGTTIYGALQRNHNYNGSYSSLSRYLRALAAKTPRVTTVLEFAPGEAAQVDFGKGPQIIDVYTGEIFKTWVFVMVLAWSRHQYAELVRDQSVETWLGCHRRAFEHFNGVPAKIIIDNPKCAITKACYYDPQVQRSYADYAEGYGFLISPCPVADPQKKGRVESGVKYAKNNFMPLREFRDLAHANQQLSSWVMSDAGNRIHGTTRTPPLKRFVETEQALLKPLPSDPPQCARWTTAKLHGDCHIQVDTCRYSAALATRR